MKYSETKRKILIAPSILSADFKRLYEQISLIESGEIKADLLHIDVMDGHYVPNLTIGPPVIRALRDSSKLFFETHLMVSNPDALLDEYIAAGSDRLIFHAETCPHLHKTLTKVKDKDIQCGLALNPSQGINTLGLENIGKLLDTITVMTVNPGFSGQKFISQGLEKIKLLKKTLLELDLTHIKIEVDGGVGESNAKEIVDAGAEILVAGNAVYGQSEPLEAIKRLRKIVE